MQRAVDVNWYESGRPSFPHKDNINIANYPNSINVLATGNVDMTKHHVVPWVKLKKFVKKAVYKEHDINPILQGSAAIMITQSPLIDGEKKQGASTSDSVKAEINAKEVTKKEDQEAICTALCWTPGNLFIGPRDRSDDPGEGFETNAANAVGGDRYPILGNLNNHLDVYDTNPTILNINLITADFAQVHAWDNPVPFDINKWEKPSGGKKWRLKM